MPPRHPLFHPSTTGPVVKALGGSHYEFAELITWNPTGRLNWSLGSGPAYVLSVAQTGLSVNKIEALRVDNSSCNWPVLLAAEDGFWSLRVPPLGIVATRFRAGQAELRARATILLPPALSMQVAPPDIAQETVVSWFTDPLHTLELVPGPGQGVGHLVSGHLTAAGTLNLRANGGQATPGQMLTGLQISASCPTVAGGQITITVTNNTYALIGPLVFDAQNNYNGVVLYADNALQIPVNSDGIAVTVALTGTFATLDINAVAKYIIAV